NRGRRLVHGRPRDDGHGLDRPVGIEWHLRSRIGNGDATRRSRGGPDRSPASPPGAVDVRLRTAPGRFPQGTEIVSVGTTVPTHRLLTLALTIAAALALPASAHAAPKLLLDATTVLDAPLSANAGED